MWKTLCIYTLFEAAYPTESPKQTYIRLKAGVLQKMRTIIPFSHDQHEVKSFEDLHTSYTVTVWNPVSGASLISIISDNSIPIQNEFITSPSLDWTCKRIMLIVGEILPDWTTSLSLFQNGLVCGSKSGRIEVWKPRERIFNSYASQGSSLTSLITHNDGFACGFADVSIAIWPPEQGELHTPHVSRVSCLTPFKDGLIS